MYLDYKVSHGQINIENAKACLRKYSEHYDNGTETGYTGAMDILNKAIDKLKGVFTCWHVNNDDIKVMKKAIGKCLAAKAECLNLLGELEYYKHTEQGYKAAIAKYVK